MNPVATTTCSSKLESDLVNHERLIKERPKIINFPDFQKLNSDAFCCCRLLWTIVQTKPAAGHLR